MISYKYYNNLNLQELLKNKEYLKRMYEMFKANNHYNYKIYHFKYFIENHIKGKENNFFLILKDNKVVGYNKGFIIGKTYYSKRTYILDRYQGNNLGSKLKLRVLTYLFSKQGITSFFGLSVVSNKIFKINEKIVNRKNLSKSREYFLKNLSKEYVDKNG
jgi:hypothetical protein